MTEENRPVENQDLVIAIGEMFNNNNAMTQSKMIDQVMRAKFIIPIIIDKDICEQSQNDSSGIDFHMLENSEKQKFFMAFTDWDELEKWKRVEGQQTAILTFDDYSNMVLDQRSTAEGFVINPFGENLIFNKRLIDSLFKQKQAMNSGVKENTMSKETQVLFGKPDVYPQEMVDSISAYLKTNNNVKSAFLRFMVKDNKPSYLIVVDCLGDIKDLIKGISDSANDYMNGLQISLFPYESELGKSATLNQEPFYKKK